MTKISYESSKIKIMNDNVISTQEVNEKSIDLIVTSPPYNVD